MSATVIQPDYLYCDEEDLQAFLSVPGEIGTLDDDLSNTINTPPETVYLAKAIMWATAKCNFYLMTQYAPNDLAASPLVNEWCTICAAKWLSARRGNPTPESIDSLYQETLEDMKLVKSGDYQVPDIGAREAMWPVWSNVRVSNWYALRKIRVEVPLSEQSPAAYPQARDVQADLIPFPF